MRVHASLCVFFDAASRNVSPIQTYELRLALKHSVSRSFRRCRESDAFRQAGAGRVASFTVHDPSGGAGKVRMPRRGLQENVAGMRIATLTRALAGISMCSPRADRADAKRKYSALSVSYVYRCDEMEGCNPQPPQAPLPA